MNRDRGYFDYGEGRTAGRGAAADQGGFTRSLAVGMSARMRGGLAVLVPGAICVHGFAGSGSGDLELLSDRICQSVAMCHRAQQPVDQSCDQHQSCRYAFEPLAHATLVNPTPWEGQAASRRIKVNPGLPLRDLTQRRSTRNPDDDMLRKGATALLLLAVLLIGLKPMADLAAAAASSLQQPCCADCDQPAMPDGSACGTVGGCVAAPPFTPSSLVWSAVAFDIAPGHPLLSETGAALADTTAPFRPPRTFLIA